METLNIKYPLSSTHIAFDHYKSVSLAFDYLIYHKRKAKNEMFC